MFTDIRLDLGIDRGTVTTLTFNTTIQLQADGFERRISNWLQPLATFQIGARDLTFDELTYITNFFEARKGSYEGFVFRDWGDYQLNNPIAIANGIKKDFQLCKIYAINDVYVQRPIFCPRQNLQIYLNGVLNTNWSTANGVIKFNTAPPNNTVISAIGEFDVPVRFEKDNLDVQFVANGLYRLENLTLKELRFAPDLGFEDVNEAINDGDYLNTELLIGYDFDTTGGPVFKTEIYSITSGFEKRFSKWPTPQKYYQLGNRSLLKEELNYLISFFRIVKGSALAFNYRNHLDPNQNYTKCRFVNDSFSYTFGTLVNNIGLWETNNYVIRSVQ